MSTALYLSYDGMTDPLGQSQVIPYLEGLAAEGHSIHLVSAEKAEPYARLKQSIQSRLDAAGIIWHTVTYTKKPPVLSSIWDMWKISRLARQIDRDHDVEILHARSLFMAVVASKMKRAGQKLVFDMRGFWADERVDGGLWSLKNPIFYLIYKYLKKQELKIARESEAVVVLTNAAKDDMRSWQMPASVSEAIHVIPTCADLDRFKAATGSKSGPLTFGYVGSVGTWYLFEETLKFFVALSKRRPDAELLVINRSEHDLIRNMVSRAGIDEDRLELKAVDHHEVPNHVLRMDIAAAIIRKSYSKIASAPTKLGEYLGCGVPCVGNVGVGDMERILEGERVGIALTDFSNQDIEKGVDRALALLEDPDLKQRCVAVAQDVFSLESGVRDFCAIYSKLGTGGTDGR